MIGRMMPENENTSRLGQGGQAAFEEGTESLYGQNAPALAAGAELDVGDEAIFRRLSRRRLTRGA